MSHEALEAEHTQLEAEHTQDDVGKTALGRMLAESRCPFGPRFFLSQLAPFVRDRCPGPNELPRVDLWIDGETHTICHVVAIAPRWLALAVWNGRGENATMSLEIVPYELISRVTIGAVSRTQAIGFAQAAPPAILEGPIDNPDETFAALARTARCAESSDAGSLR